jgi:hypothetical protein
VIDHEKAARVMMFDKATLLPAFDIVVYGATAEDLMVMGHPAIQSLVLRFPDHQSSPFHIRPMRRPKTLPRRARPPRLFAGSSDE